jgi:16S rRNA C967 or C1407 C5-methylase (RsmB/RsmF family)
VYATCSLEPEETHEVVDAFLAEHAAFAQDQLPEWAQPFARDGRVELDPARREGDGFFAVRLRRASLLGGTLRRVPPLTPPLAPPE